MHGHGRDRRTDGATADGGTATDADPGSGKDPPTVLIPHVLGPDRAVDLRDAIGDAEVVVTFRLPEELLAGADDLRWVQALSAGVDHFDREGLAEAGIALTNASGVHAEPIAEQEALVRSSTA